MCFGVIHLCADPSVALRRLSSTLLPGGILQLGTYSTLGVKSWRPSVRRMLHGIDPDVIGAGGELIRQPTPSELRAIRARVFELARGAGSRATAVAPKAEGEEAEVEAAEGGSDMAPLTSPERAAADTAQPAAPRAEVQTLTRECATARTLRLFEEFYSASGSLDLLFHPKEATFTLLEVEAMLDAAGLESVGVYFWTGEQDRQARGAFSSADSGRLLREDPHMRDLRKWHALERRNPALFGRMHVVYCRLKPSAPTSSALSHEIS